jgi:SRSO17 transposase
MPISTNDYCQYLTSSHLNFTCTFFAEHKPDISHDQITRFLAKSSLDPKTILNKGLAIVKLSSKGWLIFDDTVLDKNFSLAIELVRKQYSGNEHRVIKGIGLVACIYYNPSLNEYWLLDYRIYDKDTDGKKKPEHMLDLIDQMLELKLEFQGVLCDCAYATTKLFERLEYHNKYYVCNIKPNRTAKIFGNDSDSDNNKDNKDKKDFKPITELLKEANSDTLEIQLNKLNSIHKTKLFKSPISTDRTDYLVTNCPDITTDTTDTTDLNGLNQIQKINAYRWKIEQFHREIKQNTGIESCQCRKRNSQKNHIMCSLMVWVDFKQKAEQHNKNIYQQKKELYSNYLKQELANPSIKFSW